MGGRGGGRGRGGSSFNRVNPFAGSDQININPAEKVPTVQTSLTPYPTLDHFPAVLSTDKEFDEQVKIKNRISSFFQSSNYYLKLDDENSKLFLSQGENAVLKKTSLNFNWDYFPLELRPTSKRKAKDHSEILANFRKSKLSTVNLSSWLDKLEEKEKNDVQETDVRVKEELQVKKETEEARDEEEEEEFDDEELDDGTDYNTNYFDNGEGYLDEDDDLDEGPCY